MDAWLLRACAKLRIKLVHSQPGRPEGRGKIERFFRTVRDQFLAELTEERAARVQDLAELNKLFTAWAETVYHVREHSETGQPPLAVGGRRPVPAPGRGGPGRGVPLVRMADHVQDRRRLPARQPVPGRPGDWPGKRVELVFDPFDLNVLFVRHNGKDAGTATPHHITRHSHPKARPEDPGSGNDVPRATGVDYLALIGEQHDRQRELPVNYTALIAPAASHGDAPACERQEQHQEQQDGQGAGRRTAVDDFRQVTDLDHATSDGTVRLARTAAEASGPELAHRP